MATVEGFTTTKVIAIEQKLDDHIALSESDISQTNSRIENLDISVTGDLNDAVTDLNNLTNSFTELEGTVTTISTDLAQAQVDVTTAISGAVAAQEDADLANSIASNALLKATAAIKSVVIEYALSSSETTVPSSGWSTSPPARTPGDFIWSRTTTTYNDDSFLTTDPVLLTGNTGSPGSSGAPTYTWLKYADTPTTGMSDLPSGKVYMGVAYNKSTATESTNYGDYAWSLIKGEDGSDGTPGKGVASTAVTYQVGSSGTTAPTGTWITTIPSTTTGQFLWTRTVTTYTDAATETSYSVAAHGATGSDGRGISSTEVTYQVWASGTSTPTGTWAGSPQATTPGQFLWTRTVTTYTDTTTSTSYSVSAHGETGQQGIPGEPGADGTPRYTWIKYATTGTGSSMSDDPAGRPYIGFAYNKLTQTESTTPSDYTWSLIQGPQGVPGTDGSDGANGRGIASTTTTYQVGSSGTTAPTGTWTPTIPATTTGQFLWTRIVIAYTDASPSSISYNVSAHGATGPQGTQGVPGIQGPAGADGAPTYTWLKYADTPTTGMSDLPTGKKYMGIAVNKSTATESSVYGDYAWSLIEGPQGNQGIPGTPGTNGVTTYTWLKYADTPTTGMSDTPTGKKYIGLAVNKTTATESATYGDYTWSLIEGPQGNTGTNGVSVVSITPYFLLVTKGTAAPAKPTTNPPGGSWSLTEPNWTTNTDLYRTELIIYSNATFSYTGDASNKATKVSSYTAATKGIDDAATAVNLATSTVVANQSDPGHQVGRIWLQLNSFGKVIGIQISNGSAWSAYMLTANTILVPGTVDDTVIMDGAIKTGKIAANAIVAKNMLMADLTNYAEISGVVDGTVSYYGWTTVNVSGWTRRTGTLNNYFMFSNITLNSGIPFQGGDTIVIDFKAKASVAVTASVRIWRYLPDGGNSVMDSAPSTINITTSEQQFSVTIPITDDPAATSWIAGLYGVISTATVEVKDVRIRRANTAELIVDGAISATKLSANALAVIASENNLVDNPWFADWTGTMAAVWSTPPTGFSKETNIVLSGPNSLRYNVAANGDLYCAQSVTKMPNAEFITIWADVYLTAGNFVGSGLLARWTIGGANRDAKLHFADIVPAGEETLNRWYRMQAVVQRPGVNGTYTNFAIFPMGGWPGFTAAYAAKNITFSSVGARPSSQEEIDGWQAGKWRYNGTTTINGGAIQTDTVTATQIQANAINAKHTITAPLFQTHTDQYRGIKIFATKPPAGQSSSTYGKILAFDDSNTNNPSLVIDGETGSISMRGTLKAGSDVIGANITGGTIQTGTTGARVAISDTGSYSARVQLWGPTSTVPAQIDAFSNGSSSSLRITVPSGGPTSPSSVELSWSKWTFNTNVLANGGLTLVSTNMGTSSPRPGLLVVEDEIQHIQMVGEIRMWAKTTAPAGWLVCDGAAVSRTTYAALYAAIGTAFGIGNGSTTFNLPDFRRRFPWGYDASRAIGSSDGVVTPGSRTPDHDHASGSLVNSTYNHNLNTTTQTGGSANRLSGPEGHTHTISGATDVASSINASGSRHFPNLTVNFIIRYR